jgi:hypothetical protein
MTLTPIMTTHATSAGGRDGRASQFHSKATRGNVPVTITVA